MHLRETARNPMSATADRCRACHVEIFFALYEKPPHKANPLVRPKEGEKPNIDIYAGADGKTYYRIVPPGTGEFLSHFSNCPERQRFKASPKGDK